MGLWVHLIVSALAAGPVRRPNRRGIGAGAGRVRVRYPWLGEPRNAVFLVLALSLLIGGGRKVLSGWRARRASGRLGEPDVTAEDIATAAAHGRSGLIDLFRLLGTAETEALRHAAGHALSVLWARDDLIAEEEKALVRRGFTASWAARRRYPRAVHAPIPIAVAFGVPFLRDEGEGVHASNLEWSYRVVGARRAALETFGPWTSGPGRAGFAIVPDDFETDGPHRLELHTRVRTTGLTESWELELPHLPFTFEFDPILEVGALCASADQGRGDVIGRAVRLGPGAPGGPALLDLNASMALRDPPSLAVTIPLPCDLAHAVAVEFEGIPGRFEAGAVVLSGQGTARPEPGPVRRFPIGPLGPIPPDAFERPGPRRLRAVLTADPERGWSDPDVRSIWPGTIVTDWLEVQVVRR